MQNDMTHRMDEIAKELMDHEDVDSVQIVVTFYDPIAGETYQAYVGMGNAFARKQILQDLVDNDLEPQFDSNDMFIDEEDDDNEFGGTE